MQFNARARNVHFSPFKLRPLVDVIRGKSAAFALQWLKTISLKRSDPVRKVLESAVANAKFKQNLPLEQLHIKDIRVDQGPTYRYFKPGAMGRANIQRKRFSHISVILESEHNHKEAHGGTKG